MAQVIVDEALLREPNLWVPRKAPVGQVRLDHGHPLAPRLGCWLFGDSILNVRSLVGNENSTITGSTTALGRSEKGKYFYWLERATTTNIAVPQIYSTSGSYTFEIIADWPASYDILRNTTGGNVYMFDIGTTRFVLGYGSTSGTLGFYDGAWQMGFDPCGDGFQHVTCVFDGVAGTATMYSNGVQKYTGATYTAINMTGGNAKLFGRYTTDANAYNPYSLKTYFYALHDRALTAGEVTARYLDPYQFLIPA